MSKRQYLEKFISIILCTFLLLTVCACSDKNSEQEELVTEPENIEISENVEAPEAIEVPEVTEAPEILEESGNAEISDEKPDIEDMLIPFNDEDALSFCNNVKCNIDTSENLVVFSFDFNSGIPDGDDENVYLFEFSTYESEAITDEKEPIAVSYKNTCVELMAQFEARYLFSRFVPAILYDGEYIILSQGKYIQNPEALAKNTSEYPKLDSKKGILFDANTIDKDEFYDLNVKRVAYNIPLTYIIGESDNIDVPTIEYEYNGETYFFNGYLCAGFDSLFAYLSSRNIHCTAIILNDWNKNNPEIIHPKARKRTKRSLYYSFNTAEEEGVRLLEATANFLAERYSGGEYGMVHDWVIANEINQQTMWNYMATDNIDYYVDSFEKAFRTFYNAIKSNYSNANVYFSIDHDWNDNYGNNSRFFNGRDIVYKFNEYASRGGNYDWGLSIHPYPEPLTRVRFWNDRYSKDEEARIVTPMNLSAVTGVFQKDEFQNPNGEVRNIAVTELGFSSRSSEKLQAAAYAYSYYIIDNNEYINSYLLNRETDDRGALKSGLALGIYNNDYSPKYLKDVFKNIDSEEGNDYIPEMLDIIGADSFEEALKWAE